MSKTAFNAANYLIALAFAWLFVACMATAILLGISRQNIWQPFLLNSDLVLKNGVVAIGPLLLVVAQRQWGGEPSRRALLLGYGVTIVLTLIFARSVFIGLGYIFLYVLTPFGMLIFQNAEVAANTMAVVTAVAAMLSFHVFAGTIGNVLTRCFIVSRTLFGKNK